MFGMHTLKNCVHCNQNKRNFLFLKSYEKNLKKKEDKCQRNFFFKKKRKRGNIYIYIYSFSSEIKEWEKKI